MKVNLFLYFLLFSLLVNETKAQNNNRNLILVTMDGLRWQEVFGGADSILLRNTKFTKDSSATSKAFWNVNQLNRRELLFPFFWGEIASKGQIHGNRKLGSKINVANKYQFSYPGYNELLTGYPDSLVNSNDKIKNQNTTVLEFINKQENYQGKVAAFTSWDAFPYIINKWRSGVYVNSDTDTLKFDTPGFNIINDLQFMTPKPLDLRTDIATYLAAKEYIKTFSPKVVYIAFDETDDFAHHGEYDLYLKSAHSQDAMIGDLWKYIQSDPRYKDNTTLFITCDHGRGDANKEDWKHHGAKVKESGETWFMVIGPEIVASGECKNDEQLYQKQFAATFGLFLGMQFKAEHPVADPMNIILNK